MKNILAEIVTIGDEILYGQITDTNTQWISAELDKIGVKTVRKSSVGDDPGRIMDMFAEAESRADIILMTGGLGPTKDDLTKKLLVKYFDTELILNEEALKDVESFFIRRGIELTELNRQQAALPANATFVSNKVGTAPGMWFEKNCKVFISMPGVPHEMKWLMENEMIPRLKQHFRTPVIYHKMIKTVGIGESFLAEKIEAWEDHLPLHIRLAYLPSMGQVKLRLTATGENLATLQDEVQQQINQLLTLVPEHIYGYDQDELESVIGQMLIERNLTLATAESCTGGFLGHSITRIPGSSRYYLGGLIPYSNEVKINQLGVKRATIEQFGAVSEETVKEMAENIREKLEASIGVSTSGVAGPDGGTDDKPVGTIWIAFADGQRTVTKKLQLVKDREINIRYTALAVLNLIRQNLAPIV
jgi:nicotinamide-nucleotide amidase